MTNELNEEQVEIIKNWQDSFLGKALAQHVREYFFENEILKSIPDELRQNLIEDFYKKIFELSKSDEPLLMLRGFVASYVHSYAIYQVLCLTEKEKETSFFRNASCISAGLHRQIKSLSYYNDELRALTQGNEELTDEDLLTFCRTKAAISMFYLNGMNIVRFELKDVVKERDWLRPFIESMLIWEEDKCRESIGLPGLLTDKEEALKHGTFLHFVTNGSADPYVAWEAGKDSDSTLS